jgi:hypothetical protein
MVAGAMAMTGVIVRGGAMVAVRIARVPVPVARVVVARVVVARVVVIVVLGHASLGVRHGHRRPCGR